MVEPTLPGIGRTRPMTQCFLCLRISGSMYPDQKNQTVMVFVDEFDMYTMTQYFVCLCVCLF